MNDNKLISIVTVTYNSVEALISTMKSLIGQNYNNFEYIIIDGASSDNTMEIVSIYEREFSTRGIDLISISEKDDGIYDAMNKGISMAKGKWIYFLNSGDTLYSTDTLKSVSNYLEKNNADIMYGGINAIYYNREIISTPRDLSTFDKKMPFCHQGVFVKTKLAKQCPFETKYKIISDYNMMYKLYLKGYQFKKMELVIANYSLLGKSGNNGLLAYKESIRMKKELKQRCDSNIMYITKCLYHYLLDKSSSIKTIKEAYITNSIKRKVL